MKQASKQMSESPHCSMPSLHPTLSHALYDITQVRATNQVSTAMQLAVAGSASLIGSVWGEGFIKIMREYRHTHACRNLLCYVIRHTMPCHAYMRVRTNFQCSIVSHSLWFLFPVVVCVLWPRRHRQTDGLKLTRACHSHVFSPLKEHRWCQKISIYRRPRIL